MKPLPSLVIFMLIGSTLLTLPMLYLSLSRSHKHRHVNNIIHRSISSAVITSAASTTAGPADTQVIPIASAVTLCSGNAYTDPTALPPRVTCLASNNTAYSSAVESNDYIVLCDVGYVGQNTYPFVFAGTFEASMIQCPHLSRDGGKGGEVNGIRRFLYT